MLIDIIAGNLLLVNLVKKDAESCLRISVQLRLRQSGKQSLKFSSSLMPTTKMQAKEAFSGAIW